MTANHPPPTRARYICTACSRVHDSWAARCSGCATWDLKLVDPSQTHAGIDLRKPEPSSPRLSVVTATDPASATALRKEVPLPHGPVPKRLSDVRAETFVRMVTGLEPLDAVLGGGLVEGSSVLLAAPRGVGKSTLVLQMLAGISLPSLYVSAEEPVSYIGERGRRCRLTAYQMDLISIIDDSTIETIFTAAHAADARVVVIDSIQKMSCAEMDARAGTPGQIKLCAERIQQFGHKTGIAMLVIGQMTAEDKIAGPRALEHEVDVIIELEQVGKGDIRKLTCGGKNRCGATNVVGRFKMTANGLVPMKAREPGDPIVRDPLDPSIVEDDDEDDDEPNIH